MLFGAVPFCIDTASQQISCISINTHGIKTGWDYISDGGRTPIGRPYALRRARRLGAPRKPYAGYRWKRTRWDERFGRMRASGPTRTMRGVAYVSHP